MNAPLSREDQAIAACLDARDAQFKAIRLIQKLGRFNQPAFDALINAEDSNTRAINILLELRREQTGERPNLRVAS